MNNLQIASIEEARKLPGVLLWHVSKLWQQHLNEALADLGLSSTNAIILCNTLHCSLEDMRSTQTTLAHISGVDLMTTSTALRTLETKGLVIRKQSGEDKRAYEITLTTLGKETAHEALKRIATQHQMFFGALHDVGDTKQLITILEQLRSSNAL